MLYTKRFVRRHAPIIFVLVFGIFFSVFSFLSLYQNEQQEYIRSSDLYAKNIISKVETELNSSLNILDSLVALYKSSIYVDRAEFEQFSRIVLKDQPGVKALQWLPRVTANKKQALINEARATDLKNYNFKKLDEYGNWQEDYLSDIYFPVYYSRPRVITSHLLGFDWNAISERKLFIESLHDANAHWCMFKDIESIPGHTYPIVKPLFDEAARDFNNAATKEHLLGLLTILVSFDDVLQHVLSKAELNDTELHIYFQDKDKSTFIEIASTEPEPIEINKLKSSSKYFYSESFNWAGANFILMTSPPKQYIKPINIYPSLFFSLCITALAILLSIYLWKIRRREEEIQEAVTERTLSLKLSNEELDKFAYITSHDLKEPIRGIYNQADLFLENYRDKLDAKGIAMINTARELCIKLINLTDSILEFSRLNRIEFSMQMSDLQQIVNDVIFSLDSYIKETNTEIIIPKRLPSLVCDSVRVGEVFNKLIVNAIHYNKHEHKKIEIGYIINTPKNITFYVKDNGIGIDSKHFSEVFEMFRSLNSQSTYPDGSGVGLALVKRIIDRHGGKIWVESKLDEGTTFYFTLNV